MWVAVLRPGSVPRGKMKRIAFQFTPYSWVRFEWKPASSLRRWLAVCGIILVVRWGHLMAVLARHPELC